MKLFLKILGCTALSVLIIIYLAFLFVLPRKIDINSYKNDIQKLVLDNTKMSINFEDAKLITTPILGIGADIKGINLKLPDDSDMANIDNLRVKISIPHFLLWTVRVSEVKVDNLNLIADTNKDGTQYKFMSVIQDLVNANKEKKEEAPKTNKFFDPATLKIKVAHIKVNNYRVTVNDLHTNHNLVAQGEELKGAYFHRKKLQIKTYAELFSDDIKKITLNLDGTSFMPEPRPTDKEDDANYRADIGFVNPVELFRTYDLQTNIDAKFRLIQKLNGKLGIRGFANIEDLTMNLSGYQLPPSYLRAKFGFFKDEIDSNIYFAKEQNLALKGFVRKGKRPFCNLLVNSNKIYLNDLIKLSRAVMDTIHIKHNLANLSGDGYIETNANIKTNFKKLNSDGSIIIREGKVSDNKAGNIFRNINANIIFDNHTMRIEDTHLYVNDSVLTADGSINENGNVDIKVFAEKLPISVIFTAFAPPELKKNYTISSGDAFIDAKISGKLKDTISDIKLKLSNLVLSTKDNSLKITDGLSEIDLSSYLGNLSGKIINHNCGIYLSKTNSTINNPNLEVLIDKDKITVNPMDLKINRNSTITTSGQITDYKNNRKMYMDFKSYGSLSTEDLKQFIGRQAAAFVDAKGVIPIKSTITGDYKNKNIITQLAADSNNYITPVAIDDLQGKQTIFQSKIDLKVKRLKIKDTGWYVKSVPTEFTDNFEENIVGAEHLLSTYGTVIKLDRPKPIINQLHINLARELAMSLCAFKDSRLSAGGHIMLFGQLFAPKFLGDFKITDLSIPTLYTTMKEFQMRFVSNILKLELQDLLLNGSDINAEATASLTPSSNFVINEIDVRSTNIDVPRITKVSEALMRSIPPSPPSAKQSDIPVMIKNGTINMRRISSPPVVLNNTTGNISLQNNIFRLNNLDTTVLDGKVNGEVAVNLLSMMIKAKVEGKNFNTEKALLELANVKDALTGTMSFNTDLDINGAAKTQQEQLKGIKGEINFEVFNGQLGPFGKLENLILAENIRESKFFQTALGGVINSLTQIKTSHFDKLTGHVVLNDGIAKLDPITSIGPVMCMHIAGDVNIINNDADMKLRARLGSQIANLLGPLAAINPVNLVKATPGLNVGAAKLFSIFCETLSAEEMNAIPNFEDKFGVMSTTNFQIVLRGNTQKPLSMIKSFKWLSSFEDMEKAQAFVDTLPEADPDNPNASLEELQAIQAEKERLENENFIMKGGRKVISIFKKDKDNKKNN